MFDKVRLILVVAGQVIDPLFMVTGQVIGPQCLLFLLGPGENLSSGRSSALAGQSPILSEVRAGYLPKVLRCQSQYPDIEVISQELVF